LAIEAIYMEMKVSVTLYLLPYICVAFTRNREDGGGQFNNPNSIEEETGPKYRDLEFKSILR